MIDVDALPRLRELLGKEENITIFVSKNPDLDSMAAATALYLSFLKAGKKTNIVCPTEPIVELSSLVGINKVSKMINSNGRDLTIILPYQKGKIEKISYNIENDKIHLVVKAGEEGLGFDKEDIIFSKTGGELTGLIFLVGVSNPSVDLNNLYSEEILKSAKVVNISDFTQGASSISEIIATILNSLSAPLDVDIAQNLMSGIIFATNNLQNEEVTPVAFEMVAFLLKYGAKRNHQQHTEKPMAAKSVEIKQNEAPLDWLTPKIYKGSTLP